MQSRRDSFTALRLKTFHQKDTRFTRLRELVWLWFATCPNITFPKNTYENQVLKIRYSENPNRSCSSNLAPLETRFPWLSLLRTNQVTKALVFLPTTRPAGSALGGLERLGCKVCAREFFRGAGEASRRPRPSCLGKAKRSSDGDSSYVWQRSPWKESAGLVQEIKYHWFLMTTTVSSIFLCPAMVAALQMRGIFWLSWRSRSQGLYSIT